MKNEDIIGKLNDKLMSMLTIDQYQMLHAEMSHKLNVLFFGKDDKNGKVKSQPSIDSRRA